MFIKISLSQEIHKDKYSVQTNLIKHVHFKIMMNHPSCSMTLPVKDIMLSGTVRKMSLSTYISIAFLVQM